MNVIRFSDANAFAARAERYLLPREAEHNLSFGLLANVRNNPAQFPEPFFAVVEDRGDVVLAAMRTNLERSLILSMASQSEAVGLLAAYMHAAGMVLVGVNGPKAESTAFAETWARLSGLPYRVSVPMRTFTLSRATFRAVTGVPGVLRRAREADYETLARWQMAFMVEAFPEEDHHPEEARRDVRLRLESQTGGLDVWEDGEIVSYAGYGGPTPHGIRIGPVYTPPEYRNHGYASALVAGLSSRLLDGGRDFCFLFTDLRNPTSNHIYQEIGYRAVCDFTQYVFG
jgi:predicted GNAT family acetyltransferase